MLQDRKILVTGATGQIGWPIAERLASDNEVWCAARFTNPAAKKRLEALGVRTLAWTLGDEDFSSMPSDFTHAVHAAAVMTEPSHDKAVRANAEGTGLLMQHLRGVEAFLFVSSFGVYARQEPTHEYAETDPLGGTATYSTSYPISKIATEGTVRAVARMLEIPTTIARMNIGYGAARHGGVPVMFFSLIRRGKPVPVPIGHDNWGSPSRSATSPSRPPDHSSRSRPHRRPCSTGRETTLFRIARCVTTSVKLLGSPLCMWRVRSPSTPSSLRTAGARN
jgi:nucleoside-diphosphate-sugar epimerase